ncbi:MAG: hypothetical protein R6X31_07925 [Anaerolineae bacterium]
MKGAWPLYIFDLDGTLAETWGTTLLPGVVERLSQLDGDIAVATNQAGVAWNAIEADPYPRPAEVGRRLVDVAEGVPALKEALWLVSIGDEAVPLPPQPALILSVLTVSSTGTRARAGPGLVGLEQSALPRWPSRRYRRFLITRS